MVLKGTKNREWFRRARRDEAGQAQVEFALSILFVLLLIFGIFELSMLLYTYNVMADAAKEGVRYAIVHGSLSSSPCTAGCTAVTGTPAQGGVVETYAQASFHDITGMTVSLTYPDPATTTIPSNGAPNRVRVVVAYPYSPLLNLGWPTVTVRAASEGRIAF